MILKMRNKFINNKYLPLILILLVGIIAYHNCLQNEMFWDDDDFILKNRYIKDWKYFPNFFSENLVAGGYLLSNYWRPMLLTVFSFAWHAWGTWEPGWHTISIMVHSVDGIMLFFLLNRLFANRLLSLSVALIFVAHPVHNEAVVYVNSLGDSLATFFVLSSLLLFTRFRQSSLSTGGAGKAAFASRNYYFSLLFFPLAVMSKETGFVLCGLLPVMDVLLLQKEPALYTRIKKCLSVVWPFLAAAVFYVYLRGTALNFNNSFNFYQEHNAFTDNILIRVMTFGKACFLYAGFLFFPYQLRVERQMPYATSLFEPDVLIGTAYILLMLFCIFKFWKKRPLIAFGCAWFFIAIAPASNVLVPINALIYEHFLYMPMIGIFIVIFGILLPLLEFKKMLNAGAFVLSAVVIIFCIINYGRNLDWRTAIGFYEQLVTYAPSYRVINNLGMEYADKGIQDKALIWYTKAIAMDPKNPVAYHNIAGTYRDMGRSDLAETNFKHAIELDPKFIFAYRSLADLYWKLKRYEESKRYIEVLVRFDPDDLNAQQALQQVNAIIATLPPAS